MKRGIALVLALLLLSGCTPKPGDVTPVETTAPTEQPKEPSFLQYESGHSLELLTHGGVQRYSLEGEGYHRLLPMGEGLLLLSGEAETTLTYVDPQGQAKSGKLSAQIPMDQAAFLVTDQGISYYNADGNNLVFLDTNLQETSRISLPKDLDAAPVLSRDWQWVYYYTADTLRCLELRTGISRLLKESRYQTQTVNKVCFDGAVLECHVFDGLREQTLYISTQTGETLFVAPGYHSLTAEGNHYFTHWQEGPQELLLFGTRGENIQRLTRPGGGQWLPMLEAGYLLNFQSYSSGTNLTCYQLDAANQISTLRLPGVGVPLGVVAEKTTGKLWFLAEDLLTQGQALYCWDPSVDAQSAEAGYVVPYYTAESPDREGLKNAEQAAKALGEKYGIRIRIWKDAAAKTPADHSLTPEHQVMPYEQYLPVLEKALSAFPEAVFKKLGRQSKNGTLTVCLVREVFATNELGSQTQEQGVHFWEDGSSYLVLAMNDELEQTVYHELFHAMDSYIITETKIYDDWQKLNPSGFAYDYSYITNEYRDPEDYLEGDKRAFIDVYAMSYPKEDRARILEYAMLPGNGEYFTSKTMQNKLQTLCKGINRAFGLKESEVYLWEQYL